MDIADTQMRCTLIIPLLAWVVMACQSGHHSQQAPAVFISAQDHANHDCSNGDSGLVHRPFMVAIWRADLDSIARQIDMGAILILRFHMIALTASQKMKQLL